MASDTPTEGRCGAKLRPPFKEGTHERDLSAPTVYCTRFPVKGRTRCRLHGGLSLRGIVHPNYQGRGYSKDLPTALHDVYNASANNPDQSSNRQQIALIDVSIHEIVRRKYEGQTPERMLLLRSLASQLLNEAREVEEEADPHLAAAVAIAERIKDETNAAVLEFQLTELLNETLEERRKLADTERRREEFVSKHITEEQARAFVDACVSAIKLVPGITRAQKEAYMQRIREYTGTSRLLNVPLITGGTFISEVPDEPDPNEIEAAFEVEDESNATA